MTNYSLRARMMILILAPTVLIGLLLSIFFVVHRYNDLQRQLEDAGASIIEPLAVSTEYGMSLQNRESIGQLISPRFYVSTSKSIIKALINMHSFEIQLSPIG
ncbi:hypothetical protein ACXYS0_25550 [Escherichia coli]